MKRKLIRPIIVHNLKEFVKAVKLAEKGSEILFIDTPITDITSSNNFVETQRFFYQMMEWCRFYNLKFQPALFLTKGRRKNG